MSEGDSRKGVRVILSVTSAALLAALAAVLLMRAAHREEGVGAPAGPEAIAVEKPEVVTQGANDAAAEETEVLRAATADVVKVAEHGTERYVPFTTPPRLPFWRASLVTTITAETIEETARNLGNPDEHQVYDFPDGGWRRLSALQQNFILRQMARVRRLLAEGRENPQIVVRVVRKVLSEALDRWPQAGADEQLARLILGSTYVLAELGGHDSLPLLLRGYRQSPGREAPVPPAITLYAMHRLVCSYPDESLSREARGLRVEYRESARCLPEPVIVVWEKMLREDEDPNSGSYGVLVDRDRIMLERQVAPERVFYRHCYEDGQYISDEHGDVPERTVDLFTQLEKFVRAAYPGAEF